MVGEDLSMATRVLLVAAGLSSSGLAMLTGWGTGGSKARLRADRRPGARGFARIPPETTDYLGLREAERACERSFERCWAGP